MMNLQDFTAKIDATNLRLDANDRDIQKLCEEALTLRCACVMIYPTSLRFARELLKGSKVALGTVIGFPSGRFSTEGKAAEILRAAEAGANEVDIVMQYAALREGEEALVEEELCQLCRLAHDCSQKVKVITENCYLNRDQKLTALRLCEKAGADLIKTSTGLGTGGATIEDIELWASHRKSTLAIKAAGGIRSFEDARNFIAAGAARLGTSNAMALAKEFGMGAASSLSNDY